MNSSHSYLPRFVLLLALALSLVSCGGGSSGGGGGTATATITGINPVGLVAATTHNISLTGTNFTNGMTLSITSSSGTTAITPTSITSTLIIVNNFSIATAPSERYVTVNLKSSGGTTLASTILGVANNDRTMAGNIQAIFDSNCISCHSTSGSGGLNLTNGASVNALVNTNSSGCSSRFRVTPGDPRRSSSVLVDKIRVLATGTAACSGGPMPPSPATLTSQDIDDIIDWIAGGVR